MPAFSHQHRRTLRSVLACTCGEDQSIQKLASHIERHADMLPMPDHISISLSCEKDCTTAAIQDIGAIQTQESWDIYTGGIRGAHARSGMLFCVTDSEKILPL